jgi:hypothetical protein
MKKKLFSILVCSLFFSLSVKGQDNITKENNAFSEARFNYFKQTAIIFNEYLDTKNGSFNTTNFRLSTPIGNNAWNLRFDLPLVSTNTESINKTGIGDLSFASSYIFFINEKRGIAARLKVTSNSSNNPAFGSGKWVLSPSFFLGTYIGKNKKLLLLSDIEYQFSFSGSNNRTDISTAILENTIIYSFAKNWIGTNVALRYNAINEGFQNTTFIEFGRKFTADSMFYIHPSIAFGSEKSYNYGLELGLVILF